MSMYPFTQIDFLYAKIAFHKVFFSITIIYPSLYVIT